MRTFSWTTKSIEDFSIAPEDVIVEETDDGNEDEEINPAKLDVIPSYIVKEWQLRRPPLCFWSVTKDIHMWAPFMTNCLTSWRAPKKKKWHIYPRS